MRTRSPGSRGRRRGGRENGGAEVNVYIKWGKHKGVIVEEGIGGYGYVSGNIL